MKDSKMFVFGIRILTDFQYGLRKALSYFRHKVRVLSECKQDISHKKKIVS